MNNEFKTSTVRSIFSTGQWIAADYAAVSSSDIIAPWRSTFGISINAARLAADQPLVLYCREDEEITELLGAIETHLTSDNSTMKVLDRLEEILTPERQTDEKLGLQKILSRLETTMVALVRVKDAGFHAVVINRQRQPSRPALEALRHAPILNQGQPTGLNAGFLLPAAHHFTL